MKMFELLPRPLGSIFRKLTHLTCNSRCIKETTQMKMFELLPRPLGSIFRKLTHLTCNSRYQKSNPLSECASNHYRAEIHEFMVSVLLSAVLLYSRP